MWQAELSFFPLANTKDADQAAHMHRLVCAFVVRMYNKVRISRSKVPEIFARIALKDLHVHVLATLKIRD